MDSRCCSWEVTRGPHATAVFAFRHPDATSPADGDTVLQVGRQTRCWMRLAKDLEISSLHAEFRISCTGRSCGDHLRVQLRDLQSTNGTKLNGEPLVPQQDYALTDQDLVLFGKSAVRFRVTKPPASENVTTAVVSDSSASDDATENSAEQETQPPALSRDPTASEQLTTTTDAARPALTASGVVPSVVSVSDVQDAQERNKASARGGSGGGGGFTTDDDVFETFELSGVAQLRTRTHSRSRQQSTAETSASTACMICSQWLGHLDVLEQQLHINSCLDGNPDPNRGDTWRFQPQALSTATVRRNRKRKRALGGQQDDDEVAIAVALSKSITSREQEVDMDMALLSGELAQLDAQMAKLAKKREVLMKRMVKLEKTKAKVKRSAVLVPADARVLLDWSKALEVLFPEPRGLVSEDCREASSSHRAVPAVVERYRPLTKLLVGSDSTWSLPSMWLRASQQLYGHSERDLYRNNILLPFDCEPQVNGTTVVEAHLAGAEGVKVNALTSLGDRQTEVDVMGDNFDE